MQNGLLARLFGQQKAWHGPCTVVLDANATIQATGNDAIMNAGMKSYSPRLISGRIAADFVSYLPEDRALALVQQSRIRQATGEDTFSQLVFVVDADHVAGVEFPDAKPLEALGLTEPPHTVVVAKLR